MSVATFQILTVCSGNICRSPLAEALLRKNLRSIDGLTIASAGLIAGAGDLVTPEMNELASQLGVDLGSHRSTYLQEKIIGESSLIFAMSRSHRRAIVEMVPRKVSVTFTIREFARLSQMIDDQVFNQIAASSHAIPEKLASAIAEVRAQKGQAEILMNADDDDVIDPYRRDDEIYQLTAAQLVPAADRVSRVLLAATGLAQDLPPSGRLKSL